MVLVVCVSLIAILIAVGIHFEALILISGFLSRRASNHRIYIAVCLVWALLTHVLEITIFGLITYILVEKFDCGEITGVVEGIPDYIYFSCTTYTTLGYGDLMPVGPIKFFTSIISLSGLMLLGWSASFTFLEMRKFWRD